MGSIRRSLDIFNTRLRKLLAQFPHFRPALKLVWIAAPGWTITSIVLLLLQGLLPVVSVYLMKSVVDGITHVLRGDASPAAVRMALFVVVLAALVQLLGEILRSMAKWVRTSQSDIVQDYLHALILKKSASVDMSFYDSAEFYDHLHLAREEAKYRPIALLESVSSVLQNCLTLIAMAAVLIRFGFIIPIALVLSTLPALYVLLTYTERHHRRRIKNIQNERWAAYYSIILCMREVAAEIRIFSLGDFFISRFESLRKDWRSERLKLHKEQRSSELIAGVTGYLVSGACLAWMVWKTLQLELSLGDLAMFYTAFNQGQQLMRSLLENMRQVYENSLFLGHLFEFLGLQPQVVSTPLAEAPTTGEGFVFHNVTFCYPGSQRRALLDFNLEIPAGKITAIVGANGAGKTTLIKLLCRFYDPDSGSIELNGVDLRDYNLDELRRKITVLFQDPVHYTSTVAENIGYGDVDSHLDQAAIRKAAESAGAEEIISRLPSEYDTLLGKFFSTGVELSVGEWQRIALARAFFRRAPVILLDEPTSSMDSWAEADWMKRFRNLVLGQTALIITHRFTTAMRADVIHVMQRGQVIESGSHEDLIAMAGQYAQAWAAQMERPSDRIHEPFET
jgi:ATP-binding cassette subfamily B protein